MARTHTVSIYLLREGLENAFQALRNPEAVGLEQRAFSAAGSEGTLFVSPPSPVSPPWLEVIDSGVDGDLNYENSNTGAVLVLNTADRWFAVTFGTGRVLLEPSAYERRFGLRAALNAVDPTKLRAAQAKTFNENRLQSRRQVSRLSDVEALELDAERDLMTALNGSLVNSRLGLRIEGRDAARLTAALDADGLVRRCKLLLSQSQKKTYRKAFPWFDRIEELDEPAVIDALEAEAASKLATGDLTEFDLFPPDIVDDEVVSYRLYPTLGGHLVIEPDTELARRALRGTTTADEVRSALERVKLIGVDGNGEVVRRWSLWSCLQWEHTSNGARIVLDDGRWFRVAATYAKGVDAFVRTLTASTLGLPPAQRDQTEAAYNSDAATAKGFALLDKQNITLPGRTAVEPCDLFTPTGALVHVKRRKGGSGPLSHLLGQMAVSAELLLNEPEFRNEMRTKLAAIQTPLADLVTDPWVSADHDLVLGLITNKSATGTACEDLPFFTKVFLRQNVLPLRNMGFNVFVDEIPVLVPGLNS